MNTTVAPPAPILPTVLLSAAAAVEGQPVKFTAKLKFPYSPTVTIYGGTRAASGSIKANAT